MTYTDNEKFKNPGHMLMELRDAGVSDDKLWSEADRIFQYNLEFLANTYEHQVESRALGINRTRNAKGKFR